MTNKELADAIATIHNNLAEIKVSGDDVFKMAEALVSCRSLVSVLRTDSDAESN